MKKTIKEQLLEVLGDYLADIEYIKEYEVDKKGIKWYEENWNRVDKLCSKISQEYMVVNKDKLFKAIIDILDIYELDRVLMSDDTKNWVKKEIEELENGNK